jgi:hypothetical protein
MKKKWTLKVIAAEQVDFKRKMMFLGWLADEMEKEGVSFTVVGGEAAEIYTFGKYESADIDIVTSGSIALREKLKEIGFQNQGKDWWSEDLRIFLEITSSVLAGDETRVKVIDLGDARSLRVIGVEDIILDRLAACKFWKYKEDCEVALDLMARYRKELDMRYLEETAKKNSVLSKLKELMKDIDEDNTFRSQ